MSPAYIVALVMLIALIVYALLGGADFGGGILDALAFGERKREQRDIIEHAIGPVWEANHVWLILVVVLLFTCFPQAFAAISVALFVPLVGLLLGIVLRGAAFIFRAYDPEPGPMHLQYTVMFSLGSILAPMMLGISVATVASGTLHFENDIFVGSYFESWLTPFAICVGLLTAALFAYLAAVYLTVESKESLREVFRRKALVAWGSVSLLAIAGLWLSNKHAPAIYDGLTSKTWSLPLLAVTALLSAGTLFALLQRRYTRARILAAGEVTCIIVGWAGSLAPYLVVPHFTIEATRAPDHTLELVLFALAAGAFLLVPSLYFLFRIFKSKHTSPR